MMSDMSCAEPVNASMEMSDLAFEDAKRRGLTTRNGPSAISARYDPHHHAIIVVLDSGAFVGLPVEKLQGLQGASALQLNTVVIEAGGLGMHWPDLDADLFVPALLDGLFGSNSWMAARLGAAGGKATSDAKVTSSRRNGARGGRPRKSVVA
nr:DUF2442 domain-containing protein [uncultured Gellertiella sp.]